MKKKTSFLILEIIFIVLLVISLLIYYNSKQSVYRSVCYDPPCWGVENQKVCFKQDCFNVEIAQTAVERERGLMFRERLCDGCGMLFVFEWPGKYPFWMKNVLIPLDIIWIDSNKKIVYIKENAEPCISEACESFITDKEASYVLEMSAGFVKDYNLSIGDEFELISD